MKRPMSITVRGRSSEWTFTFDGDPNCLREWRDDGLEVYEVHSSIPLWVASVGLARPWSASQRLWQWMRLW